MASVAAVQGQFLSLHQQIWSQNPDHKPSKPPRKKPLFSLKNVAISAVAAGALIHAAYKNRNRSIVGIGGGEGGGGEGGVAGGGGGGGGGGGISLLRLEKDEEWDAHGLPSNMVVPLNNLSRYKMYKASSIDLVFLDRIIGLGYEDSESYSEMVSLRAGGVYSKALLQKELATLAGMFEKVDLEVKTNPDGTIGLTISGSFMEFQKRNVVNIKQGNQVISNIDLFNVVTIKEWNQLMSSTDFLSLFDEVNPCPDEKDARGSIFKIKLKEVENKSAECSIDRGRCSGPSLAVGTVSFEHRNIKGLNRSFLGTVTTSNLFNPQDDVVFNLEYVHPYLDGVSNSRTLRTSCFNSRKLTPVFTGLGVAPIWVDRAGIKTNITENVTPPRRYTYGIVMEEIITRDRSRNICSNGKRVSLADVIVEDGPPTTLSGTGIDRMVYAQANITSDNTKLVNGQIVGNRNILQMDQGLGIGSTFPFFNRHQITMTRFIQLKEVEKGAGKAPPPVAVLHGRYGGCVGNLPRYNAFTLGWPCSSRGVTHAATKILELAAEVRIQVRSTHTQIYGFAEYWNDLGSSQTLNDEVYGQRIDPGSFYGVGAKIGLFRAEYAINHKNRTVAMFLWYGERF